MESHRIAMQGPHAVLLGQNPTAPQVAQYTTVNMAASANPPKDHIIWSIFNLLHSNFFCLGLVALIYSVKARDRKMVGDLQGAKHYGATARSFNIAATVLFGICIFSCVTAVIVLAVKLQNEYYYNYYNSINRYGTRY